uniref:OSJNBb0089K06.4 protein n=1 Tax=Oryza sativa subsp. japonica TaxID=39947 RepID=Q7XP00_ORYSJ|nr:OSJNBb0089K06.4 [Oryza sativa Japonica Group]
MAAPTPSNFNLRSILEKEKLTGTNFMDWYRNLRIVLRQEHKEFVLTQPFPVDLPNNAIAAQCREHERRCNEYHDISCLMLATMSPKIQRQYEALDAHTIITGLRNMFEDQARAERFNTSKSLFACRLAEGNANRTLAELHGMLKTAEESIKKNSNHVMVMHKRKPNNKKSGQKRKLNSDEIMSTSNSKTKVQKTGPAKNAECFFCKETGHWKRNFYNINAKRQRPNDLNPTFIWHCRLGHINEKRMEKLHRDGLLHSFDFESFETYEFCLLGKMTKAPFTGQSERSSELLGLVHIDVCEPMSSTARGGFGYFITFTDDFSRYVYVYLMRHKSESFEKFKEFQNEVQNHLGKTIKYLRSDRGGEYLSLEFGNHLKECGIVPQLTPPGTPQWNRVSERRNRTLLDMVQSMMSQTDLPLCFWGYALETAAFTLNRVPSKSVDKTSYEIWTGKRPSLSFLKIWGCEVYVKRLQSDKLTPKSDKCFFVGYPKETKGYYFYNREEGKVFVARHSVFLEKEFISRKDSGSMVRPEEIQETPENASTSTQPQAEQDVVQQVFKKKTDVDGNVYIYKARLVVKGFRQIQGVDYDETFSPAAMLKSIRIVLAVAAYFDYEIWQMDVKTAFLNGNLDEDVYMTQSKGFVDPQSAKKICKLHKSIYGLKQASQSWNIRFDEVVKALVFVKNKEEPCVYKKINDILLIGNDIPMLESVKTSLKNSFSMKDLGEAAYILGIRIYRDRSKRLVGLSQSTYIDKVLKRFNMQDSKKGFLPMSYGINLGKNQYPQTTDERNKMSVIPYASAIGSIMYAMLCTRLDVSYALSVTNRYQSDPGESHWIAVKNILKYLRRTKDMFLVYGGQEELVVNGYTDASFQTDKDDFRS